MFCCWRRNCCCCCWLCIDIIWAYWDFLVVALVTLDLLTEESWLDLSFLALMLVLWAFLVEP